MGDSIPAESPKARADFLDGLLRKMALSIVRCGEDSNVRYKEIYMGYKTAWVPEKVTASSCAFCASHLIVEQPPNPNLIRPESVIPFKVPKEEAVKGFRGWLGGLWFRPNSLKRMARLSEIQGVYTPFWTFDARARSRWKAESGEHYYEQERYKDSEGRWQKRRVQKTRWKPATGDHQGRYDDLLVCGSRGLSPAVVRTLEPFNTRTELVPYRSEYLSGWAAEEYAVGPKEAWEKGRKGFEELEFAACGKEVPGDTHRNLRVSTVLDGVTWKHVLLPAWIAAYRYQGKVYHFLVNGETGELSGQSPLSWWKILGLIALSLMILAILGSGGTALIALVPLAVMGGVGYGLWSLVARMVSDDSS